MHMVIDELVGIARGREAGVGVVPHHLRALEHAAPV